MVMGMGKGGPLVLVKAVAPALAIECVCLALPRAPWKRWQALLAAYAGVVAWVAKDVVELWLAGADKPVLLTQAAWSGLGAGFFSTLAALLAPTLLRRLAHHGLIPEDRQP
jgi:hypothetical protein